MLQKLKLEGTVGEEELRDARAALAELERALWVAEERDLSSKVYVDVQLSKVDQDDLPDDLYKALEDADDGDEIDADVYYQTADGTIHAKQVKSHAKAFGNNIGNNSDQLEKLGKWVGDSPNDRDAIVVVGDNRDRVKDILSNGKEPLSKMAQGPQDTVVTLPSPSGEMKSLTLEEFKALEKLRTADFRLRLDELDHVSPDDVFEDWGTLEQARQWAEEVEKHGGFDIKNKSKAKLKNAIKSLLGSSP